MILAVDAGGTKVRVALYEQQEGDLLRLELQSFASSQFDSIEEIIEQFLKKHQVQITNATIGVPGPVINGIAEITNLPWIVREDQLARQFDWQACRVVNDLVATTASVPFLKESDLLTVHAGRPPLNPAVYAVVAPGTGLGQGFLLSGNNGHTALASEGGHVDFAPVSQIEIELLQYCQSRFGSHVSYERVLSGPGLVTIYDFLKKSGKFEEPPELSSRLVNRDPDAAVISRAALNHEFEICVEALSIFTRILGGQAGNLALTLLADGGVYLGGGIPPKICPKLKDGELVEAYLDKGRLSDTISHFPLHVILDDHAALLGAASIAADLCHAAGRDTPGKASD